jgi:hypothetical protein
MIFVSNMRATSQNLASLDPVESDACIRDIFVHCIDTDID